MKINSIEKGEYPVLFENVIFYHEENDRVLLGMTMKNGIQVQGQPYPCSHWISEKDSLKLFTDYIDKVP